MMGSPLKTLLAEATDGPWSCEPGMGRLALRKADYTALRLAVFDDWHEDGNGTPEVDGSLNARLAALAPELAQLAIDMADTLHLLHDAVDASPNAEFTLDWEGLETLQILAMLARFRALEQKAGK